MLIPLKKLAHSPESPVFERLNRVLKIAAFDAYLRGLCARFYAPASGRLSLRPGRTFGYWWWATLKS